jgi:hypothetical protein
MALPATTIALAAALLVPSSAAAERLEVLDRRGDYWHDHRVDGGTPSQSQPEWGNPDIRRTAYRHWLHRVSVRIKLAQVDRNDSSYWTVVVKMRTNEGLRRTATWFRSSGGGISTTWSGPGSCAIDGRMDDAEDAFIIDIPRSCLSRPTRIAFKSATRWLPTSDDAPYVDVSGQSGYRLSEWSAPVRRG